MVNHPLRYLLNEIKWTKKIQDDFVICYIHRGAPGNTRRINFSYIGKIGKGWFEITEGRDLVYIPFHRIIYVIDTRTNEVLWKKR